MLANDLNPAGGGLTIVAVTQPAHGAAIVLPGNQAVRYAPAIDYSGVDSFTYTIRDVNGQQSMGLVAVVVTPLAETDEAPQIAPVDPTVQSMRHFTSSQATVTVDLPAGFYTGTVGPTQVFFLSYTPVVTPTQQTHTPPGTLKFGNFEFELAALLDDQPLHGIQFEPPITLTIHYNPALMTGLDLPTLELLHWDGQEWSTGGVMIVSHDIPNATLVVAISHLSDFALFAAGEPTNLDPAEEPKQVFLPAVMSGAAQAADVTAQGVDVAEQEAPIDVQAPISAESEPPLNVLYLPEVNR